MSSLRGHGAGVWICHWSEEPTRLSLHPWGPSSRRSVAPPSHGPSPVRETNRVGHNVSWWAPKVKTLAGLCLPASLEAPGETHGRAGQIQTMSRMSLGNIWGKQGRGWCCYAFVCLSNVWKLGDKTSLWWTFPKTIMSPFQPSERCTDTSCCWEKVQFNLVQMKDDIFDDHFSH